MPNCNYELKDNKLTLKNSSFSWTFSGIRSAESSLVTPKSRSMPCFEVKAIRENGESVSYRMWDDLSVVRIGDDSEDVMFELYGEHWSIRTVRLNAFTDECDTLVDETLYELFFKGLHKTLLGDIFIFESALSDKAYVIISETPDHTRGYMEIKRRNPEDIFKVTLKPFKITVKNGGYPIVVGECKKGEAEALCRSYLRHANVCPQLVTMSNTWGDCHSADRVCEAFIEKEIEAAREIGVDIVQIDDGWQAGNTLYTSLRDERGNRIFDDRYWELNTERFPNGIMPLTELAAKYGIQVGMWFAPSSHDCFAKLERDKAALRRCYEEYGARFFKLDMYQASDKAHVEKMLELLAEIYSFGDDVSVQMDVTRYERLNYLCGREYGSIFVENRYTKYGISYPYKVLKNLWDISRYLPSNRFQFELINPELNKESYPADDIFAPQYYTMDYLFAAVMLSNPLFWMEIQFLSKERRAELAPLLNIWKEHRKALAKADVMPIGERPNGRSLTGFYVSADGKPEYLLVFRECTDRDTAVLDIPTDGCDAKVLYSNADADVKIENGRAVVTLSKERAYAFIKLN